MSNVYFFSISLLRCLTPLFLGVFVSYFTPGQTTVSQDMAYFSAVGLLLSSLVPIIAFHPFIFFIFRVGTRIRLGLSGLIYRKLLTISNNSSNDDIRGRAINLLSTDLSCFDVALAFLHDIWKGPTESVVIGYLMYREIGISAVIGVAFLLSFIPLQAWVAKKAAYFRLKTAEATDLRVKLMNEIIQGIQVIKMYAWEKSFANVISKVRRKEVRGIRGSSYIFAGLACTSMISPVSVFISLVSFVYFGNTITARHVFTVSSYFNMLNESMVHFWPLSITFLAEAYVSAKRCKEFLLDNELHAKKHSTTKKLSNKPKRSKSKKKTKSEDNIDKGGMDGLKYTNSNGPQEDKVEPKRVYTSDAEEKSILFKNILPKWDYDIRSENETDSNLSNMNIKIKKNSLVAVVGAVGSGKSTLLNLILGEVPIESGELIVNGKLSYCSQESWLFESSVRDNIVFVEQFDKERYKTVIRVCALERDLSMFPNGDMTIVGERGVSLSGGQKARISLARAVYRQADIYLLDDPLSAVDTHVGKHIYENCIRDFLAGKIRILVTHQIQYLRSVQHLIVMSNSIVAAQGSYDELQKMGHFQFLQDEAAENDALSVGSVLTIAKGRLSQMTIESDRSLDESAVYNSDSVIELSKENQEAGSVKMDVYFAFFHALESNLILLIIVILFILARVLQTAVDYFLSRW